MKRLIRFAGIVAGAAAVAYLLRDRLVRLPEDPAPPPHFRSPNGEAKDGRQATRAALADDLTEISGVGPVYAKRLEGHGITTFAGLAETDVSTTAEAIEVAPDQVADWADQARQRLS